MWLRRDIKESNFLSNHDNTSFCLVDLGGAKPIETTEPILTDGQENKTRFYYACVRLCRHVTAELPARGGTSTYRAFEVNLRANHQSYVDIIRHLVCISIINDNFCE